jgi:hypothetical protein
MDSSHLRIAGFSLVLGAILSGAFFILGVRQVLRLVGAPAGATQPSNPNDSPVTMRGGSVEGLSFYQWSQPDSKNHPTVWETSGIDTSVVIIEGNKGGTTPGIFSATGITSNWEITLIFRDQNDGPDYSGDELVLCSKQTKYTCDQSGALSSGSNPLYLIADGNSPGTFYSDLKGAANNTVDGYALLRYDVPSCGAGDPRDTRCNHLAEIDVSNLPGLNGSYTCQAGGCEIGIGPPIVVVAKPRK